MPVLIDMILEGAKGLAAQVAGLAIPEHWTLQAKARLADFNPFEIIKGNHDLTRAARIAWIQAAMAVLDNAREASTPSMTAFLDVATAELRSIRREAWDRRGDAGSSPIDAHVNMILGNTPVFVAPGAPADLARPLTHSFVSTLAQITGWAELEIPERVGQIARAGLPTVDGRAHRAFGELVYAAFAELLKDPGKYPQANPAFVIAMQAGARDLATRTLAVTRDIDAKVDQVIRNLDAALVIDAGAGRHLSLLPRLALGQDEILAQVQKGHRDLMDAIVRERGVPLSALQAQLDRLGQLHVAPENVPDRIEGFVTEFLALKRSLALSNNLDPVIAESRSRALALLDQGDLDGARGLLEGVLRDVRARRQQMAREEASLIADQARIDMMQLRYDSAIAAFAEAAGLVAFDDTATREHVLAWSNALIAKGTDRADNDSLGRAIDVLRRRLLPIVPRHADPLEWAGAQNTLGWALTKFGERKGGTTYLQEAVAAYRLALDEFTREHAPLKWAATQNNLGIALARLGDRERSVERLEAAVEAYRAALLEWTRASGGRNWAVTQNNLGTALRRLGDRDPDTGRLRQAVAAYRLVLEEFTREASPLDWAIVQNNLGNALATIGGREGDVDHLHEAVAAFRAALEICRRERTPLDWAMTQGNLANALVGIAEREGGAQGLEYAVEIYQAALEECTRERMPLGWALMQRNLGHALVVLGERQSGSDRLTEAVAALSQALVEFSPEHAPQYRAMAQKSLDKALALLSARDGDDAATQPQS
jgi:tetratricopeptide (TPR) repeat protein